MRRSLSAPRHAVKWMALGLAAAVAPLAPATATAQDDGPMKVEVTRFDVPAHQTLAFQKAVGLLVEAANAAELGEEFTWWFHKGNGYYSVVSPVRTMARFDDPDALFRAISGTPGEAKLKEFMAAVQNIDYRARSQVVVPHEDWSYRPEDGLAMEDAALVHVLSFRVRPSMEEALNQNLAGWKKAMASTGFPYAMDGYRTLLGDGGMAHLVFHADDRSSVYGKNDLRRLMEAKGMAEEYDRLVAELLDCIHEYEWADEDYLPALSYAPGSG